MKTFIWLTIILLIAGITSCDLLWAPPSQNVFGGTATTSSSEGSTASTAVELFNNNWYASSFGSYKTNWFRFYASTGSTNYVYWNDSYSGSGSYTADIYVTAYESDLYTTYFLSSDSAYTTPKTVVPTSSGYIYLKAYSSYTGTFAIKYSNNSASGTTSTNTNATLLSASTWKSATLSAYQTNWYKFSVVSGTTYSVKWDDSYAGSGSYTCDIMVMCYANDLQTAYFAETDSAYTSAMSFTATSSGYAYLRVRPYADKTGTFAIYYY